MSLEVIPPPDNLYESEEEEKGKKKLRSRKKNNLIPYVAGIDEAGRGPVVGPMVYSIFFTTLERDEENYLRKNYKVEDSKKLTDLKRRKIFKAINKCEDMKNNYILDKITASFLTESMLKKNKYNLNAISHDSAAKLVGKAQDVITERGGYLKEVFVDTVGHPGKYQRKLTDEYPHITFTVEKKADDTYAVVSAASVMAKVTRDNIISDLSETRGGEKVGSGYPSDVKTQDFLSRNFDPLFGFEPKIPIRYSWGTVTDMFLESSDIVDVEWSDDEDDESPLIEFMKKKRKREKEERLKGKRSRIRKIRRTKKRKRTTTYDFSASAKRKKRKRNRWFESMDACNEKNPVM